MRDRERTALERLSRVGGESLVSEIVALYLEDLPGRLTRARDAFTARNAQALAKAAHALRSSSAQLGAETLASACDALEGLADEGDLNAAAARLEEVEREANEFGERLAAHIGAAWSSRSGYSAADMPRPPVDAARVAVIEDNADNRLLIDAILGELYSLEEYATGAEALAAMHVRPPDIVLLDVSLPGMDGLAVLDRMRSHPVLRAVPVVAVTAHAMKGDREHYLAAGFNGYVAKPIVDEQVLIDVVERLLSARRAPPTEADVPSATRLDP
jgi:two-component system cell cycle response regulator DivK